MSLDYSENRTLLIKELMGALRGRGSSIKAVEEFLELTGKEKYTMNGEWTTQDQLLFTRLEKQRASFYEKHSGPLRGLLTDAGINQPVLNTLLERMIGFAGEFRNALEPFDFSEPTVRRNFSYTVDAETLLKK